MTNQFALDASHTNGLMRQVSECASPFFPHSALTSWGAGLIQLQLFQSKGKSYEPSNER